MTFKLFLGPHEPILNSLWYLTKKVRKVCLLTWHICSFIMLFRLIHKWTQVLISTFTSFFDGRFFFLRFLRFSVVFHFNFILNILDCDNDTERFRFLVQTPSSSTKFDEKATFLFQNVRVVLIECVNWAIVTEAFTTI